MSDPLGEELGPPFERGRCGPGGWIQLFEPELHMGPTSSSPTSAISRSRRTGSRAEPFDAIELELGILWADVAL